MKQNSWETLSIWYVIYYLFLYNTSLDEQERNNRNQEFKSYKWQTSCVFYWHPHLLRISTIICIFSYMYFCEMKPNEIDWLIDWTIFKRFNTVLLHSLNLMGPNFNWKILEDMCKLKKKLYGAQFLVVRLILQRLCDDNQCLILVFSVIYLNKWGYIWWGPPSGYLKSFSSFSSVCLLFFFLFFIFFSLLFVSLSRALLAPGPLDIVHPCHSVAAPLIISHLVGAWNKEEPEAGAKQQQHNSGLKGSTKSGQGNWNSGGGQNPMKMVYSLPDN